MKCVIGICGIRVIKRGISADTCRMEVLGLGRLITSSVWMTIRWWRRWRSKYRASFSV